MFELVNNERRLIRKKAFHCWKKDNNHIIKDCQKNGFAA